jgi:uncharacterized protein (TIGR03118 family)
MRLMHRLAMAAALLLLATPIVQAGPLGYVQTNLVSDVPGMALVTDSNVKNPWGVSASGASPLWISNQVTGTASLYSFTAAGIGQPTPPGSTGNFVNVPPQGTTPPHGPTGQVFAGGMGFTIPAGSGGGNPNFIFATLDGSIEGWVSGNMNARLGIQVPGAVFTGLALASSAGSNYLYAADDKNGQIDVFNTSFTNVTSTTFAGKFTDPNIPAGFTPYNIASLNGMLFVAYGKPNGIVQGPGGFIDQYDTSGNLVARLVSDPTGGPSGMLNGPWGMAIAPANFGPASGDLLVGNFGNATNTGNNGTISVFSLSGTTATYLGPLSDTSGNPIAIPGLWSLQVGNGGNGGLSNEVYFSAGINSQADGLIGVLAPIPAPTSAVQAGLAMLCCSVFYAYRRLRLRASTP